MSLSRYYPTSEAFQPEELVKQLQNGSFTRIPQAKPSAGAFTSAQVPLMATPQQTASTGEAAAPSPSPQPPVASDPAKGEESASEEQRLSSQASLEKIDAAFHQGRSEGFAKAEKEFGAAAQTLLSCCQQLDTVRETIIANSGRELREFALAIAERILRLSIAEQDHTIIATIEEALQRAVKSDAFTVYVHPDDFAIVNKKANELISGVSGLNNVMIKQDITISRGGSKIESDNCTIDATVATQFQAIREEVLKKT